MDSANHKDNRAHSRVRTNVNVQVQSAPGSDTLAGSTLVCQLRDISLVGMCIYCDQTLPKDSNLFLNVEIGIPLRSFNLLGKVIWSIPDNESKLYKTGIHLIKFPEDTSAWQSAVLHKLTS